MRFLPKLMARTGRVVNRPAFLVHTAEIANHYAPIWRELRGSPFDILLHSGASIPSDISIRDPQVAVRHTRDVLLRGERYEVLVSNHIVGYYDRRPRIPLTNYRIPFGRGPVPLIEELGVRNIRLLYAAGKLGWNLRDWNALYDGVLCFGPYHAALFKEKFRLPVCQIGYPRFDRYFRPEYDRSSLIESYGGDPGRKTIVWLPTWKSLSSVGHFDAEIAELATKHNVLVKVHPLMAAAEPEKVEPLRKLGLAALITDARDNVHLYQMADVMLFDYGGPAFGAIYVGKRFILLNVPNAAVDEFTGDASPDVLLRRDFRSVNPGSGQMAELIENDAMWEGHAATCERLRCEYFAPNFGNSAAIAARAIRDPSWIEARP